MVRPKQPPSQSSAVPSDRALLAAISRGATSALGQLYDRYGPAIYGLARQRDPATAERIVEQVFFDLWKLGQRRLLPVPLAPMLIDFAARAMADSPGRPLLSPHAGTTQDALALLAQLGRSDAVACNTLVLVRLGRVGIAVSAVALEMEPAEVRHALTLGLELLRQLNIAPAEATLALQLPTAPAVFSVAQEVVEGGDQASRRQAAS